MPYNKHHKIQLATLRAASPGLCDASICDMDCCEAVYLGLRGEAMDDLRAAVVAEVEMEMAEGADEDEVAVLRKTRAGGNWLIGGMMWMWMWMCMRLRRCMCSLG